MRDGVYVECDSCLLYDERLDLKSEISTARENIYHLRISQDDVSIRLRI